jgi:hypothetical protein
MGCLLHGGHAAHDLLALDAGFGLKALWQRLPSEEILAMTFAATMIFYHLIGFGVATAVYLSDSRQGRLLRVFRLATAVVFWPLYVPILLSGSGPRVPPEGAPSQSDHDAMSRAISQVEAELETALLSLDGWVEDVLAHEAGRFDELSTAWRAQAERIREIDRLLAKTEPAEFQEAADARSEGASERYQHSEQSRRANFARLREVRSQAFENLMGTLAWVRELVSMIHLAKFTGAPASRAEELVAQIAAAIEGISAVTWQERGPEPNLGPRRPVLIPTHSPQETRSCNFSSESAISSPQT